MQGEENFDETAPKSFNRIKYDNFLTETTYLLVYVFYSARSEHSIILATVFVWSSSENIFKLDAVCSAQCV